jgi:hypothetical protein
MERPFFPAGTTGYAGETPGTATLYVGLITAGQSMRIVPSLPIGAALLATALVAGIAPGAAQAQDSGSGYFFRQPTGAMYFQIGYAQPDAGSDLFTQLAEEFTLEPRDFQSATIAAGGNFNLGSRFTLGGSLGYSGRTVHSEYRNFVGTDNLPIRQSFRLTRVPMMVQARFYLVPTGRRIGSFAWVPAKATTYIGGGLGGVYYTYKESGEFLNDSDVIENMTWDARGWAPAGQLSAGFEYSATSRVMVTGEASYLRSSQELPTNEPIDLSGVAMTLGVSFRR